MRPLNPSLSNGGFHDKPTTLHFHSVPSAASKNRRPLTCPTTCAVMSQPHHHSTRFCIATASPRRTPYPQRLCTSGRARDKTTWLSANAPRKRTPSAKSPTSTSSAKHSSATSRWFVAPPLPSPAPNCKTGNKGKANGLPRVSNTSSPTSIN